VVWLLLTHPCLPSFAPNAQTHGRRAGAGRETPFEYSPKKNIVGAHGSAAKAVAVGQGGETPGWRAEKPGGKEAGHQRDYQEACGPGSIREIQATVRRVDVFYVGKQATDRAYNTGSVLQLHELKPQWLE